MSWKLSPDGYIEDVETKTTICILPTGTDTEVVSIIENAPDMYETMKEFCDDTDSGSLRAKSTYNKFKTILERIKR